MATALQRLREAAELLPEGASVLLSKEALLGALDAVPSPTDSSPEVSGADLTVKQLAHRYSRSRSTIRGWIVNGLLPKAYRLRGREWRVPPAALLAFEEAERRGRPQGGPAGRKGERLSDWRAVRTADREV